MRHTLSPAAALLLALIPLLVACSDDGGGENGVADPANGAGETIDITDALFTTRAGSCAFYANSYVSDVRDVQNEVSFSGNLVVSVQGDKCLFETNAIPNHDFNADGSFATRVSAQSQTYEVTVAPVFAAENTELVLGDDALFLNGVKLDLLAAACYGVGNAPLGRERIGCGPNEGSNPWRYDPMSPLNGFGTDSHNAHTQPDGTYHYHGNPMAMFEGDCGGETEASPVIGFAADGFPIYGSCIEDGGVVRAARSSYTLKDGGGPRRDVAGYTTPQAGIGNIASANYDGQFRGDYEYVEGAGDLDECNGMTIEGQYGYYITDAYPWGLGCYRGTPDDSFSLGPPR